MTESALSWLGKHDGQPAKSCLAQSRISAQECELFTTYLCIC